MLFGPLRDWVKSIRQIHDPRLDNPFIIDHYVNLQPVINVIVSLMKIQVSRQ